MSDYQCTESHWTFPSLSPLPLCSPSCVGGWVTSRKHKIECNSLNIYWMPAIWEEQWNFQQNLWRKKLFLSIKKKAYTAASHRQTCTLRVLFPHSDTVTYGRKSLLLLQAVTITGKIYCRKLTHSFQWEVQKLSIKDSEARGNISPHYSDAEGKYNYSGVSSNLCPLGFDRGNF